MFHRLAPFLLVLGCNRPLVGVDTERGSPGDTISTIFHVPYAARAPHQLSENYLPWQSLVLHGSHKSFEQNPPAAHNRHDAFTNPCSESGSCDGIGAARHSGMRTGSPERSRIIQSLSSRGALRGSYSSTVYFRKLHYLLRMHRSTSIDRPALWLTLPPRYNPLPHKLILIARGRKLFARLSVLYPCAIYRA